jgi:hypothetical protein
MRSLELHRLDGTIVPLPAPSPAKIARHVKLYGNEGVEETIRAYPATALPLATYRTKAPSGRRLDSQTISAIRHFAQDSPVSALANTFNLTERRVKEVLASSA